MSKLHTIKLNQEEFKYLSMLLVHNSEEIWKFVDEWKTEYIETLNILSDVMQKFSKGT